MTGRRRNPITGSLADAYAEFETIVLGDIASDATMQVARWAFYAGATKMFDTMLVPGDGAAKQRLDDEMLRFAQDVVARRA